MEFHSRVIETQNNAGRFGLEFETESAVASDAILSVFITTETGMEISKEGLEGVTIETIEAGSGVSRPGGGICSTKYKTHKVGMKRVFPHIYECSVPLLLKREGTERFAVWIEATCDGQRRWYPVDFPDSRFLATPLEDLPSEARTFLTFNTTGETDKLVKDAIEMGRNMEFGDVVTQNFLDLDQDGVLEVVIEFYGNHVWYFERTASGCVGNDVEVCEGGECGADYEHSEVEDQTTHTRYYKITSKPDGVSFACEPIDVDVSLAKIVDGKLKCVLTYSEELCYCGGRTCWESKTEYRDDSVFIDYTIDGTIHLKNVFVYDPKEGSFKLVQGQRIEDYARERDERKEAERESIAH